MITNSAKTKTKKDVILCFGRINIIRHRPVVIYTMDHKKTATSLNFIDSNFEKCGQILIIVSLLHSEMNSAEVDWYKIYYLASYLLVHYRAKFNNC